MRKISKERYAFIRNQQKLLILKRKRRKNRKEISISALFSTKVRLNPIKLNAPEIFCIHDPVARSKLHFFLRNLRSTVISKKPVLIDFSSTQKMVASGTLLFVAELRRIFRLTKGQVPIRCIPPRNTKAWQVLEQIGVLSLLKCRKRVIPTDGDVVHWRFACGNQVLGEKYDDILGHYDGKLTDGIAKGFYHGLTEAMTNCRQHAYIEVRSDNLNIINEPTDWWMFSQEKDGLLTVVFCDLGVGIPTTLPIKRPALWQRLVQTCFGKVTDSQAIREAIEDSKSRTGKHYRGKGLRQLLEVAKISSKGTLIVYSNNGIYLYDTDRELDCRDYNESIAGTLIAWQIKINSSGNIQDANN